jgi:UDP:flavonoid glycosyltransferase YjiC (YdhE family)
MVDHWLRPVHDLRREIGLGPGGNPLLEGGNSPDLVLALFSNVLASPQPDWPPQAVVTGFPFHDEPGQKLAPEVEEFLQSGPAPIAFTLGSSAVLAAGNFYAVSLKAIERLQARALFLTGSQPQDLPAPLPENVMIWPYAPHEQVFCRAAAIVHQGGIGTTAQAMRAGRPMLVMPFAHDQYDNGARIQRLGSGIAIPRNKYREVTVADDLRRLVSERSYRQAAEAVGAVIRAESGALRAAQAIDGYLSGRSS